MGGEGGRERRAALEVVRRSHYGGKREGPRFQKGMMKEPAEEEEASEKQQRRL